MTKKYINFTLLIVPYGIETKMAINSHRIKFSLLIVPNGIETLIINELLEDYNIF